MKSRFYKGFSFFLVVLFLTLASCVDPEPETPGVDNDAEQKTELEEEFGTRLEESLILAKGVYRDPAKECTEGFGLCEVQLLPSEQGDVVLDSLQNQGERMINAYFKLDTSDDSLMRIEFLERVPYWDDLFIVGSDPQIYSDVLGFKSVRPVPGTYDARRDIGQYGGVVIKVQKGERMVQ